MSYRLITNANFVITSADGTTSERVVEVRLYPAPKRDAQGVITVDGEQVQFKRTGGKGRGTADNRYAYAPVKGQSGFWAITEAEAAAMIGGTITLTSVEAKAETPAATEAAPAAAEPAKEPEGKKAARRGKAKAEEAKAEETTNETTEAK